MSSLETVSCRRILVSWSWSWSWYKCLGHITVFHVLNLKRLHLRWTLRETLVVDVVNDTFTLRTRHVRIRAYYVRIMIIIFALANLQVAVVFLFTNCLFITLVLSAHELEVTHACSWWRPWDCICTTLFRNIYIYIRLFTTEVEIKYQVKYNTEIQTERQSNVQDNSD